MQSPAQGQPLFLLPTSEPRERFLTTGPDQGQTGGAVEQPIISADAYVWSVIHSLDSPPDSSEYLPRRREASPILLLVPGLMVLVVIAARALLSPTLLLVE